MATTHFSGPVVSTEGFTGSAVAQTAGSGITDGAGAVVSVDITKTGKVIQTSIFLDMTGLQSSTTDLDIIGTGSGAAYLLQVDNATMGQLYAVTMTCLEAPVTGITAIDLYSATEATGVFDAGVAATLVEVIVITAGAAWTVNKTQVATPLTDIPADTKYLYLTCGAGSTVGTYTAGQFLIEMWGYES